MSDSLWGDEDTDPLDDPRWAAAKEVRQMERSTRYIGCPVAWLKRALPVVRSAEQLAVALYIYRLTIICKSKTVTVSNAGLKKVLGISRKAKHRTLAHLEQAGLIRRHEHRNGCEVKVTLLD